MVLLALLVIFTGHQTDGLQGKPPIEYGTVWRLMQIGSAIAAVGLAAVACTGKYRRLVRISLAVAALSAGGAAVGMLFGGESWRMNEPGLAHHVAVDAVECRVPCLAGQALLWCSVLVAEMY